MAAALHESPAGTEVLEGTGLHSGLSCRVSLSRSPGALVFAADGGEASLHELVVTRADHGVEVALGPSGPRIDGVEHLLAAAAGLGIGGGVRFVVEGGEVPILDGGALAFCRALRALGAATGRRRLVVVRDDEIRIGSSSYAFLSGEGTSVEVEISFEAPGIGTQRARWDGTPRSFEESIAWARTFGFRRDAGALLAAGRGRGATPDAVMILDDAGRVEPPGNPARKDEHACHKLLDLVGDAALFGGPPRGATRAVRPGHRATHAAFRAGIERGSLRVETW